MVKKTTRNLTGELHRPVLPPELLRVSAEPVRPSVKRIGPSRRNGGIKIPVRPNLRKPVLPPQYMQDPTAFSKRVQEYIKAQQAKQPVTGAGIRRTVRKIKDKVKRVARKIKDKLKTSPTVQRIKKQIKDDVLENVLGISPEPKDKKSPTAERIKRHLKDDILGNMLGDRSGLKENSNYEEYETEDGRWVRKYSDSNWEYIDPPSTKTTATTVPATPPKTRNTNVTPTKQPGSLKRTRAVVEYDEDEDVFPERDVKRPKYDTTPKTPGTGTPAKNYNRPLPPPPPDEIEDDHPEHQRTYLDEIKGNPQSRLRKTKTQPQINPAVADDTVSKAASQNHLDAIHKGVKLRPTQQNPKPDYEQIALNEDTTLGMLRRATQDRRFAIADSDDEDEYDEEWDGYGSFADALKGMNPSKTLKVMRKVKKHMSLDGLMQAKNKLLHHK